MPFADLREFITAAHQIGELRTVRGADWDLEIGTITELNYERQGPALLFDELEVKRGDVAKQKLPEYPPPAGTE